MPGKTATTPEGLHAALAHVLSKNETESDRIHRIMSQAIAAAGSTSHAVVFKPKATGRPWPIPSAIPPIPTALFAPGPVMPTPTVSAQSASNSTSTKSLSLSQGSLITLKTSYLPKPTKTTTPQSTNTTIPTLFDISAVKVKGFEIVALIDEDLRQAARFLHGPRLRKAMLTLDEFALALAELKASDGNDLQAADNIAQRLEQVLAKDVRNHVAAFKIFELKTKAAEMKALLQPKPDVSTHSI